MTHELYIHNQVHNLHRTKVNAGRFRVTHNNYVYIIYHDCNQQKVNTNSAKMQQMHSCKLRTLFSCSHSSIETNSALFVTENEIKHLSD